MLRDADYDLVSLMSIVDGNNNGIPNGASMDSFNKPLLPSDIITAQAKILVVDKAKEGSDKTLIFRSDRCEHCGSNRYMSHNVWCPNRPLPR